MNPDDRKTALVTGARKGLGRAIAEALLADGWRVAGCSRSPSDLEHADYQHILADVSDEASVVDLLRTIRKSAGRLDALINNAGVAAMNAFMLTPRASVESVVSTNLCGVFYVMREGAKLMSRGRRGGRIINFSSVAGPLNLEGEAIYAASKAAVESLTRIGAREFGGYGITVNAVGPTPVDTDLIRAVPKDKIDGLVQRQAIRRLGTERDVINVVRFFLGEDSDFVTGQIVYLGGISG